MSGYNCLTSRFMNLSKSELGSLLLLYIAFFVAGFVATIILLLIMTINPQLEADTLSLKVAAFTSPDGPVALFVVWCLTIILFAWWKPTQTIIRYYGKRLEEFAIVVFSAFLGAILAIGLWGLGWSKLGAIMLFSALALFLSVLSRKALTLDDRGNQVVAAGLAGIAIVMFTFGPAYWPTWFFNYVTP